MKSRKSWSSGAGLSVLVAMTAFSKVTASLTFFILFLPRNDKQERIQG